MFQGVAVLGQLGKVVYKVVERPGVAAAIEGLHRQFLVRFGNSEYTQVCSQIGPE